MNPGPTNTTSEAHRADYDAALAAYFKRFEADSTHLIQERWLQELDTIGIHVAPYKDGTLKVNGTDLPRADFSGMRTSMVLTTNTGTELAPLPVDAKQDISDSERQADIWAIPAETDPEPAEVPQALAVYEPQTVDTTERSLTKREKFLANTRKFFRRSAGVAVTAAAVPFVYERADAAYHVLRSYKEVGDIINVPKDESLTVNGGAALATAVGAVAVAIGMLSYRHRRNAIKAIYEAQDSQEQASDTSLEIHHQLES